MIIISIVFPVLLAARTADVMYGVFLCFVFALIVNVFFVLNQAPMNIGSRHSTIMLFRNLYI